MAKGNNQPIPLTTGCCVFSLACIDIHVSIHCSILICMYVSVCLCLLLSSCEISPFMK